MASPAAIAIKRVKAEERLTRAALRLGQMLDIEPPDFNVRVRQPDLAETMRLEIMADYLADRALSNSSASVGQGVVTVSTTATPWWIRRRRRRLMDKPTWDSVTVNSSDSPILAGQDAVVAVFDGANYLYCGKSAGTWKLLWTDRSGALLRGDTAGATPVTLASGASAGPFAAAYGMATQRLAGSVAQGTAFSHEADCLIEWTQVALPTFDYTRVTIRDPIPDEPFGRPEWWLMVAANGTLLLYERDDVGGTTRASTFAGAVVNGDRVVVVAEGTTITGYSTGVQRWSYADATVYATAMGAYRLI